jgi:transcriptional regulator with XRE-family HTH domain/anti-sigma regulatory factor (Ser/Thr protein kinase)
MTGEDIMLARRRRGWTQKELARRVARSQAMISQIEAGRMKPAPSVLRQIESVLAEGLDPAMREAERTVSPVFYLPDLPAIPGGGSLPVRADSWQRPEHSGDFMLCLPLPRETILIAAVDVAGHGTAVLPSALYLQGWLRGWTGGLTTPPRLQSLVEEFSRELSRVKIDAGGYFALVTRSRGATHAVSYEAVAYGFRPPLLILGPPFRTPKSADLGPPLPASGADLSISPVRMDRLSPWRLVLASDGLLSRLGEGQEERGLRFLLQWQTGPARDELPERHLATGVPLTDDESFLLLQWAGWDLDQAFDIRDDAERHQLLRTLGQEVESTGPERTGAFLQGVVEALSNAHRHGGSGIVSVRFREEPDCWRLEVEDEGLDNVGEKEIRRAESGFALMHHGAEAVDVRKGRERGTVVSLILDKPLTEADSPRLNAWRTEWNSKKTSPIS